MEILLDLNPLDDSEFCLFYGESNEPLANWYLLKTVVITNKLIIDSLGMDEETVIRTACVGPKTRVS